MAVLRAIGCSKHRVGSPEARITIALLTKAYNSSTFPLD
eukprot:gene53717-8185_t